MRQRQISVGFYGDGVVLVGIDWNLHAVVRPEPRVVGEYIRDSYARRINREHFVLVVPPGGGLTEPFDDPAAEPPEVLVDLGDGVAIHIVGRVAEPSPSIVR